MSSSGEILREEGNAELIKVQWKSPVDKVKLLDMIRKLASREKGICLVNLILLGTI